MPPQSYDSFRLQVDATPLLAPTWSSDSSTLPDSLPYNSAFAASSETLISHGSPEAFFKEAFESPKQPHSTYDLKPRPRRSCSLSSTTSTPSADISTLQAAWALRSQNLYQRIGTSVKRAASPGRCYAFAGIVGIFLLVFILSVSTPVGKTGASNLSNIDISSIKDYISSPFGSKRTCDDPWTMPGYIWYGKEAQDVRWVPYKFFDQDDMMAPENAKRYNPEREKKANKSASLVPPAQDMLPLEFSKAFKTYTRRNEYSDQLSFMRDKHVMIYGSSLDREMVKMFCKDHQHGGEAFVYQHHRHVYCHFEDYNFTITATMHFGMHQSDWFKGDDEVALGTQAEARIDSVIKPLTDQFGKPDLLIFSTGLWDLMYFNQLAKRKDNAAPDNLYAPVSYERLQWHRARLTEVIGRLQAEYPDSPILYRTTTQPTKRRGKFDNEMVAVFQLNQSAKALMKRLRIPIFNWSELIKGNHETIDNLHFAMESRPNWLYGEQLVWTLRQLSDSRNNLECWLDR